MVLRVYKAFKSLVSHSPCPKTKIKLMKIYNNAPFYDFILNCVVNLYFEHYGVFVCCLVLLLDIHVGSLVASGFCIIINIYQQQSTGPSYVYHSFLEWFLRKLSSV